MSNVTREELRTVAVFHDLPDEQLDWFLEHRNRDPSEARRDLCSRGRCLPTEWRSSWRANLQGRIEGTNENVFTTYAGAVTGVLPYSRMKVFPATGRAIRTFANPDISGCRVR